MRPADVARPSPVSAEAKDSEMSTGTGCQGRSRAKIEKERVQLLRREQAATRGSAGKAGWDEAHGVWKFNPLADWTEAQVWSYAREQDLPVNALHARGYPSIGCAPCTRAIAPGEDARAGRWWWESAEHKECGLHPGGRR